MKRFSGPIYSRKLLAEIDSIQYSDAAQRRLLNGVQLHIVDQSKLSINVKLPIKTKLSIKLQVTLKAT